MEFPRRPIAALGLVGLITSQKICLGHFCLHMLARLRGTIQLKLSSFALRGFDLVVLGANLLVRISSITI